jgi:hypothetical protein
MTLPIDWRFNPEHTGLDESGALNTGEGTLLDWAATLALTAAGELPEDGSWGAGLGETLRGSEGADAVALGEQLRGLLYTDDRVADASTEGTSEVGLIRLPVRIEAADGPYRLTGRLTPSLIEDIIVDIEGDDEEEDE